jgi:N utilization substance protein B
VSSTRRNGKGSTRSQGRELALQLLYSFEQNKYVDDGQLLPLEVAEAVDAESSAFAHGLFQGFIGQRTVVDAAVDQRLENWTIQRLAVLDRALLRLGAYELLCCADTPPKVTINEYIELAKRYGSEAKTAKLVNGVLDKIAREHRPAEVARREPPPAVAPSA